MAQGRPGDVASTGRDQAGVVASDTGAGVSLWSQCLMGFGVRPSLSAWPWLAPELEPGSRRSLQGV